MQYYCLTSIVIWQIQKLLDILVESGISLHKVCIHFYYSLYFTVDIIFFPPLSIDCEKCIPLQKLSTWWGTNFSDWKRGSEYVYRKKYCISWLVSFTSENYCYTNIARHWISVGLRGSNKRPYNRILHPVCRNNML